jgi:hypothetical protein
MVDPVVDPMVVFRMVVRIVDRIVVGLNHTFLQAQYNDFLGVNGGLGLNERVKK